MDQMSKDFSHSKYQNKSPWAIILIIVVVILFGAFYLIESREETPLPSPVAVTNPTPKKSVLEITSELEASVGAIEIPSYSDSN